MSEVLTPASGEADDITRLMAGIDELCAKHATPYLVATDGHHIPIPPSIFDALKIAVQAMSHGATITLAPQNKELTSQEAADLLLMSRPHLIKLLDRGEIPHHKVGRNRRIRIDDVLAYRARRYAERERVLTELAQEAQAMGGYE